MGSRGKTYVPNPANFMALESDLPPDDIYFGQTAVMQVGRQKVTKAADTDVPLLIEGENGTGKEVLARLVQARSGWSKGAFVKVNCAAVPRALMESGLFGYGEGAFTGGDDAKALCVELKAHGTSFLG